MFSVLFLLFTSKDLNNVKLMGIMRLKQASPKVED